MNSWNAKKSAEREIRDWLQVSGYHAELARFVEFELHAIERFGGLQIFRFECILANAESQSLQLFGAMRSDERFGRPKIFVDEDRMARDVQLDDWSQGLISHRRHRMPLAGENHTPRPYQY